MARHVTQFGSTVNIPDEGVDRYRSSGFVVEGKPGEKKSPGKYAANK